MSSDETGSLNFDGRDDGKTKAVLRENICF